MSPEANSAERQLFLSFSSMVQGAETLEQDHHKAKTDALSTVDKCRDKVQNLWVKVKWIVFEVAWILYCHSFAGFEICSSSPARASHSVEKFGDG